ncbi:hypothetical protein BN1708_007913 [Verticillium longisporum]|uniref:Uncharacterized protein n=1 Tax=Verticillium longisporum TaxID=100787 RepID=A0A0G4MXM9_VERLO|nr:hypothetical protein BN1708_007913 [Verticillium longisporum]
MTTNSRSPTDFATVNILDASHRQALERALTRILHTNHVEVTYAEILDGMPLAATYREFFYAWKTHPSVNHIELCSGSLEKARDFRAHFKIASLQFSLVTLLAFQDAASGSKQFYLRLLELLAVSCHRIAVYLYDLGGRNHHHTEHERWRDRPGDDDPWGSHRPPIVFTHGPYNAFEQYPHGLADVAAYWAEARIFGGVFVFDRGETETECREIYMHACFPGSPRTLFALTSKQFGELIHFLLDEDGELSDGSNESSAQVESTAQCPLPIRATSENRWRWDPWDAIARFHVFRDKYERKVAEYKPIHLQPARRTGDWPELGDQMLLDVCEYERQQGTHVDQAMIDRLKMSIKMVTPSSPLWPGYSRWAEEQSRPRFEDE